MPIKFIKQSLDAAVEVYVPSEKKGIIFSDAEHCFYVNKVVKMLTNLFGGATTHLVKGIWTDPDRGIVEEVVSIVTSNTDKSVLKKKLKDVFEIAIWLKVQMQQDEVFLKVNNKALII